MQIHRITTGIIESNIYVIQEDNECIFIDAGMDAKKVLRFLKNNGLKLKYILMTHGHYDHGTACQEIRKATKCKIYMSSKDIKLAYGSNFKPDNDIKDNDEFKLNNIKIKAIATPGHTPGLFCLYIEKENILFSGDTLFKQGIGRTDFPGSSEKDMIESLKKLFKLPENTIVYPGHGEKTTIKGERRLYGL